MCGSIWSMLELHCVSVFMEIVFAENAEHFYRFQIYFAVFIFSTSANKAPHTQHSNHHKWGTTICRKIQINFSSYCSTRFAAIGEGEKVVCVNCMRKTHYLQFCIRFRHMYESNAPENSIHRYLGVTINFYHILEPRIEIKTFKWLNVLAFSLIEEMTVANRPFRMDFGFIREKPSSHLLVNCNWITKRLPWNR